MEIIGTVLGIILFAILAFIVLCIFLFGPGFIGRLIFRKVEEVKLANFVSLIITFIFFAKTNFNDFAEPFSEGFGKYDVNILKWFILLQILIVFAVARYLARGGIEGADKFLKKINPNQRLDPIVKTSGDEVEAQGTQGHP